MRAAILLCLALVSCSAGNRFDQTAWKNADLAGRVRADMLPDFLKRYPLIGRTRSEVVALLGEPTPTDKWDSAEMIYVLGNDGSYMAIDHEWLLIDLDHRQRVVSFRRVRD
jgi:outer membrane protein assembly factor BamE (lipoprotein component of BamABCDE complex)